MVTCMVHSASLNAVGLTLIDADISLSVTILVALISQRVLC